VRGAARALLGLVAVLSLVSCLPGAEEETGAGGRPPENAPNVVLIVTDDQEASSTRYMPNLRSLLMEKGTTFENAFVTNSICCPSRATILRGQYAHNHEIVGNSPPQGGSEKFHGMGLQGSTVASWLWNGGYRTALVGKYLNGYEGTYVPWGWDEWHAVSGNYMSTELNENGEIQDYGAGGYHLDDVLAGKATDFVREEAEGGLFSSDEPFFVWLGPKAPHQPATAAPRHEDALPDVSMPRPPSVDEADVSDKPAWIRDNPSLTDDQLADMETLHRNRMRSMLAVDDAIGRLVRALRETGELDDTYIFFVSDNGFHLGQHRLGPGKWTAYEEDIRVPLVVRGPGVPEGRTLDHMVLNNDLAPTIADLAGLEEDLPPFVDGRSIAPLLSEDPPARGEWRGSFLVEAPAEPVRPPLDAGERLADPDAEIPLLTGDPIPEGEWGGQDSPLEKAYRPAPGRPGLRAVRTERYLYAEYETGERELYDLRRDPHQLHNAYDDAPPELVSRLQERLEALSGCAGEACRAAEDGVDPEDIAARVEEEAEGDEE
jgi:arylsulfatase A-like enzyme